MDDLPPDDNASKYLLDGASYAERLKYFHNKTESSLAKSDTFIFVGHGCSMKVTHDALHLYQGSAVGEEHEPTILYRGIHAIKQIVFLSSSGYLTLDALNWCSQQGIAVAMLGKDGRLLHSSVPEYPMNAKLRRLQYMSDSTSMQIPIAREIVFRKLQAQVATLKKCFSHKKARISRTVFRAVVEEGQGITEVEMQLAMLHQPIWYRIEKEIEELTSLNSLDAIRTLEARCGAIYWYAFLGVPIKWNSKDAKIVPPHWKVITKRESPLSTSSIGHRNGTGRRAINPFHAALNYMYAVTEHQLLVAIQVEGLDPACGFLHADSFNNSSLVFDLVEPLRPLVDERVLDFFSATTFKRGDFVPTTDGRVIFNPELIRYLVASCRLDDLTTGMIVYWLKSILMNTASVSL